MRPNKQAPPYRASYYRPVATRPVPAEQAPKTSPVLRRAKQMSLVLVALIIAFPVLTYAASKSPTTFPEIKSGITNTCLDLHGDNTSSGSRVDAWPCNGTAAQAWSIVGNTIRHSQNLCLSIKGSGAITPIVVATCRNQPNQIWQAAIGGFENPASARCLEIPAGKVGSQLVATNCNALTTPIELWAPAVYHPGIQSAATISCNQGSLGQRIACNAAEQWVIWQSGTVNHNSLLNTYSNGNGYEEWCADFVSYIYKVSGDPFTNGERNGWDEYYAPYVRNENFTIHYAGSYTPKAGDVAFFNYNGGHVEIVAIGGSTPVFIYGDSATIDPTTNNGQMKENTITTDGSLGQVVYYLSPN